MKEFQTMGRQISVGLSLLVFMSWLAVGCSSPKQHAFSPLPVDLFETNKADPTIEQAMVDDMVMVKFSGAQEKIPGHEERIKKDGTITLPFIGSIKARGKTAHELETEIQNRYVPEYYKRLGVAVAIGRGFYYVSGQVQRPGRYNYFGPTTITKAIESAGGLTEFAGRATRVCLTHNDGKAFVINCPRAAKDPSFDLAVYPGDRIDVPLSPPPMDILR